MEGVREFLIPYVFTNLFALSMIYICRKHFKAGRIIFGLIFLIAAAINSYTAIQTPQAYQAYERFALLEFYEYFITGFFRNYTTTLILLIAVFQLITGLLFLWSRDKVRLATPGAFLFFLGIAPLGLGSAFPSSLIFATAIVVLHLESLQPKPQIT